ncbi:TonB-dependent receptor [Chitinophaga sp.]|uniref:SusC/RagA family TonB-linked outer membrane protein n=1 Tax=Chitinophaga sp. TaxID=1869181 RepID=UPI002606C2B7|nr:TonB-dependent receptor [uncultured Chitinophaga sp.]
MKKTGRLLLIFFICIANVHLAVAQARKLTGTVTDESNQPLPGVSILLKGKNTGTTTDAEGKYSLQIESGAAILEFRLMGYLPVSKSPGTAATLDVTLAADIRGMEEVVVVGFGTRKRATVAGSVGLMKAGAIANRPITNASQALSGQVPGVWVNQQSGQPGADGATIRVRGIGTNGNANALVIIDGGVGSLRSVNPADIESISVLRDASVAIYGSRAANGVILVQTKSGKKGRINLDFHTSYGKQKATFLPETPTNSVEYMQLYNQALINQGAPVYYSDAVIDEYKNGKDPSIYPNTDWRGLVLRPAGIQTNQISISGGENKTTFNVSLGYADQDGIVRNGNAKLHNLRANVTTKVSDKLEVGLRTGIRYEKYRESHNGATNLFTELNRTLPFFGTYTSDGEYAGTWVRSINTQFRSPLAMIYEGKNESVRGIFNGNAFLNYEIIKGLKFNVTAGADYSTYDNQTFLPKVNIYNPKTLTLATTMNAGGAKAFNDWEKTLYTTLFTSLSYNRVFAQDHDLTVMAIYSQEQSDTRSLGGSIMGFVNNTLMEINAGLETPLIDGTVNGWALRSYIGRLNYSYKENYLLEGIARYDGSSRLSPAGRWGLMPSVLVGWRVTQEPFMKNQNIVDELKLRGSWGLSGNDQIGLYAYMPTLKFARFYPLNDQILTGIAQRGLVDETLKWETGEKINFGLDAGFLKNKLSVTFDYFRDDRTDILRSLEGLPDFLGMPDKPVMNLMSVRNKGWEFSAGYNDQIGAVNFSGGFNITRLKNSILHIPDQYLAQNALLNGEPLDAFYMWKAIGIFQTQDQVDKAAKPANVTVAPGDIQFEDISGPNGVPDGLISMDDRQVMGKPIPTWTYGAYLNASWKGFDARVNLQGVADVDSYVGGELYFPFLNGAGIMNRWMPGNTWTPENRDARLPRLLQYNISSGQNYASNSFWLQDASFMRIKDIQVGYSLPDAWLKRAKIQGIRVYVDIQNAFTFTRFEGIDPERNLTSASSAQYPNVRIISGGLNVKL